MKADSYRGVPWFADLNKTRHMFTGPGSGDNSAVAPFKYSFKLKHAGVFAYQCGVHDLAMQGVITVKA